MLQHLLFLLPFWSLWSSETSGELVSTLEIPKPETGNRWLPDLTKDGQAETRNPNPKQNVGLGGASHISSTYVYVQASGRASRKRKKMKPPKIRLKEKQKKVSWDSLEKAPRRKQKNWGKRSNIMRLLADPLCSQDSWTIVLFFFCFLDFFFNVLSKVVPISLCSRWFVVFVFFLSGVFPNEPQRIDWFFVFSKVYSIFSLGIYPKSLNILLFIAMWFFVELFLFSIFGVYPHQKMSHVFHGQ